MQVTRKAGKVAVLRAAAAALNGAQSKVGWFPSAQYEGGQPVAGVAYVQEFGNEAETIKPRSYFRSTNRNKRTEWAKTCGDIARAAVRGDIPPSRVLEATAMAAAGHVAETITKITEPPLKEATIAARKYRLADKGKSLKGTKGGAGVAGIAKPLIDTGVMLNTLSYEANGTETRLK